MNNYAFYIFLYPFVQELNVKTLRKKEKQGFMKKKKSQLAMASDLLAMASELLARRA